MATATAAIPIIRVVVAKDNMSASVVLRKPTADEPSINTERIIEELKAAGVVFGIDEDAISNAIKAEQYNEPLIVASGITPGRGTASTFTYHFHTRFEHKPHEDADGHIDYRDLSFMQNIEEGGLLVTKTPATQGKTGMSVLGKEMLGSIGRDMAFEVGSNVRISEDGLQLFAAAGGMIQYVGGKVSVQSCLTIAGSVDHTVGNLQCKGSIKIAGDVKAGFKIHTDGDVEIGGSVEEATVIAGGSIQIKGGFFGHGEGLLRAGGDITVKFAEGQRLEAGRSVFAMEELIACTVHAKETVVMRGKKGRIVGGEIHADKEIRATYLGRELGTRTVLAVGYDAKVMRRVAEINAEIKRLTEDGERVKEGLIALIKLDLSKKLPEEKRPTLDSLKVFRENLPAALAQLEAEKTTLLESTRQLQECVIICEKAIFPGVRVGIGNSYRDITDAVTGVKYTLAGNTVTASEWKPDGK